MDFEKELLKIGSFFTEKFSKAYSEIKRQGKTKVLEHFYSIYRKWYYSAFFDENILSPAHIVYRINTDKNDGNYFVPVVKVKSKNRFNGFDVKILNYTIDNHPIVDDLKVFADSIEVVNIDSNGIVIDENIEKVLESISVDDKFYLEYLLYLGTNLKIFKKMPSIYSEVYSMGKEYPGFFDDNDKSQCLRKIFDAAVKLSCDRINEFFPDEQRFFYPEYIEKLIKEPIYVEEIFKEIYGLVGVDIEDIWQYEEEYENGEIGEFADAVLSSAYFLRILIDKWLIIPFGDYFKFIMPIYFYTYDFNEKLNGIIDESKVCGFEFSSSIYYPCSKYRDTPLACDYFGIEREPDEYDRIFKKYPIGMIIDTIILGTQDKSLTEMSNDFQENSEIYEMKVKFEDTKEFWKVIEIDSNTNLNIFHFEICKAMNLYPFGEYSFFTDEDRNPFSEYTPKAKGRRTDKRTETTKLCDLNLKPKQKIIYRNSLKPNIEFTAEGVPIDVFLEIECVKIKERNKNYSHPRVVRMSSFAKMMDANIEF